MCTVFELWWSVLSVYLVISALSKDLLCGEDWSVDVSQSIGIYEWIYILVGRWLPWTWIVVSYALATSHWLRLCIFFRRGWTNILLLLYIVFSMQWVSIISTPIHTLENVDIGWCGRRMQNYPMDSSYYLLNIRFITPIIPIYIKILPNSL